jgi:uncharacterized membrane protein YfhO
VNVEPAKWQPEAREIIIRSKHEGRFGLAEEFYPGWHATVDGRPVTIDRWREAFQAIQVPAGEHRIVFRFHSFGLRAGALVSLIALVTLIAVVKPRFGPEEHRVTRNISETNI